MASAICRRRIRRYAGSDRRRLVHASKGIYQIDAFEAALAGRVPDLSTLCSATICSKASFARAGLASDIEVVEEFPARYDVAAQRHHRWPRGDWQLLPWLLSRGAKCTRRSAAGRCSTICGAHCRHRPACWRCWQGWRCPFAAASIWTRLRRLRRSCCRPCSVIAAILPGRAGANAAAAI